MKTLDILKRIFFPRLCLFCDEPISYEDKIPICEDCFEIWDELLEVRCNRCGNDRHGCTCAPALIKKNFPVYIWSVFYTPGLDSLANSLVFQLKYSRYREVINFCADNMRDSIISMCKKRGIDYREYAVTYSPRRNINKAKYLYDQSRELAKRLAEQLGLEFVDALKNKGYTEQKELSSVERRRNAMKSYRLKKNFICKHKKYFLVDDIMTTGATLLYCSRLLYSAGATDVIPVTYAKDNFKFKGDT